MDYQSGTSIFFIIPEILYLYLPLLPYLNPYFSQISRLFRLNQHLEVHQSLVEEGPQKRFDFSNRIFGFKRCAYFLLMLASTATTQKQKHLKNRYFRLL